MEKKKILKILEEKLSKDYNYQSGNILGSMCTDPLNFGKELYLKYIHVNLGDPGLFQGTAILERELIMEIGELFNGKDVVGTITSGGTESNLIAMRIAKKLRPDIKNPEIVLPVSSHYSFEKGGEMMGIKLRMAALRDNYQLDLNHFESLINENTCGVIGIAGTTSLGLIDPIEKIGKIIEGRNIFFHIDAAFGGFVLPFLSRLNHKIPSWDFRVSSVDSITADPHKMGLGIIPSGGYLLRNSSLLENLTFELPYLAGGCFKHLNIVGTRPGAPIISFWAILKLLGIEGFSKIIKECMENSVYLAKRISEINGLKLAARPIMNIVGITTEHGNSICDIEHEMRKRKWMLGKFEVFNLIRAVIMPHVKKNQITRFVDDLEKVVKILKLN